MVYPMTEETNVSNWIQDNLRIIISIGIVVLLVFAIYSYSKRNSHSDVVVDESQIEEIAMTTTDESDEISEIIDEIKDEKQQEAPVVETPSTSSEQADIVIEEPEQEVEAVLPTQEEEPQTTDEPEQEVVVTEPETPETTSTEQAETKTEEKPAGADVAREIIASQQKDGVVTVTAVSGDSVTTLARKAAAQHIAQANITGLTPAHKIYIEDYLRRMQKTRDIHPGTTLEFSHTDISAAIAQAQTLTAMQLDNLNTYAQRVSGL